jgi:glycosyltransferase involved in cell wall biosynthesis
VQRFARGEPEYDLVTVGALLPNKRTTDFLSAVANLVREGRTIRAAVVGEGKLRSELEAQAKAAGIQDVVRFLGFRQDVHEICARSRIFVLPSRYEGLSLALVDAMALGVPPVVSDVGEARSVIEHGSTGLLFRSGDVDALTNCLRYLLDDEYERKRIADAARSCAVKKASIESVSGTLRQIFGAAPPPSTALAEASTSRSLLREPVGA